MAYFYVKNRSAPRKTYTILKVLDLRYKNHLGSVGLSCLIKKIWPEIGRFKTIFLLGWSIGLKADAQSYVFLVFLGNSDVGFFRKTRCALETTTKVMNNYAKILAHSAILRV